MLKPLANNMTAEEIMADYPYLEPEDIRQSLQYAPWLAEESVYPSEPVAA